MFYSLGLVLFFQGLLGRALMCRYSSKAPKKAPAAPVKTSPAPGKSPKPTEKGLYIWRGHYSVPCGS